MKKILLLLFATSWLIACNQSGETIKKDKPGNVKIYGKASGAAGKVIIAGRSMNRQLQTLDKDSIAKEQFLLAFDLKKPEIIYIQFQGERDNLPVLVGPDSEIKLKIGNKIREAEILKASQQTLAFDHFIKTLNTYAEKQKDLEQRYREAIQKQDQNLIGQIQKEYEQLRDQQNQKMYALAFENKDNLTGAIILQMLAYDENTNVNKLKEIYDSLSGEVKQSTYAQDAWNKIKSALVTAIGAKAPDFEGPDPNGKTLKMSDILKKSKVLVIDFWASWCRPCRRENPYVVKIYKKYHDKGLNIIGVGLDKQGDKQKWLDAIKQDKLDWYHVSHLQYWQEPIARQYGVMSIPATFILDKNGIIRAKNLRRDKLEAKIKELLEEK